MEQHMMLASMIKRLKRGNHFIRRKIHNSFTIRRLFSSFKGIIQFFYDNTMNSTGMYVDSKKAPELIRSR